MSDIHALSGAYAIDALDDIERAQFARHLAQCSECQAEVQSLREAAALLAETTAVEPPAGLRNRVLADIKNVRPLPPISPENSVPATVENAPAQDAPAGDAPTGGAPIDGGPLEGRPERRWLRGLVAAAAVVAAIGAGGVVWHPWNDDSSSQQRISAADQVLQAADAQRVTQKLDNGGEATVVASKSLNKVVVITKGLPELAEGKIYEMWLQDDREGMVPAGLMTAEDATVVLDGDVSHAVGAGITVEPAGGSRVPTSEPVALFSFETA